MKKTAGMRVLEDDTLVKIWWDPVKNRRFQQAKRLAKTHPLKQDRELYKALLQSRLSAIKLLHARGMSLGDSLKLIGRFRPYRNMGAYE